MRKRCPKRMLNRGLNSSSFDFIKYHYFLFFTFSKSTDFFGIAKSRREESTPEREDEKKVWRGISVNQKVLTTMILILEEMRSRSGEKRP